MRLLLDAMYTPEIARQLRRHGHDVVAAKERADLADASDPDVFAAAQDERRAVVTDDLGGFLPLDRAYRQRAQAHYGLVLTTDRRFGRGSERHVGQLVTALDTYLQQQPAEPVADSVLHWLR